MMKKCISVIIFSLFVFALQAQTVPTVTPANPTVPCGDTAIITASGSTGNYIWYGDSTYTNIIGTDSTIYVGPLGYDTTVYVAAIVPKTTIIETYNFTNCGVTGRTGPIQSEVTTAYSGTSLDGDVTITTQGIQEWIIPTTGFYNIEVAGAQGGPYTTSLGHGAVIKADIYLIAGDTLKILVGQTGTSTITSYPYGLAGGGGSFVSSYNNTPLIVAGGGGSYFDGSPPTSQLVGQTTNLGATAGAPIGTSGYGGNTSNNTGPGGGFYGNGSGAYGGEGFVNGGEGGYTTENQGGFGCAGTRGGGWGDGCGGGYSGGNGGSTVSWQGGAGGGSYIVSTANNVSTSDGNYENVSSFNGTSIINLANYNPHNGYATISFLDDTLSALVTVNITVDSLPEITVHPVNSSIHSGTNTGFTVTATGVGLNYQWQESTNSGTIWTNLTNTAPYSGVTTATLSITAATAGMDAYYYRCLVDGNCPPPDTSNAGILSITDVGINDFSINKTTVYPNPVNDILIVKIDNKTSDFVQISIYDVLGKLLMEFPKENLFKGVNSFDLNVGTLAKGVYYLRVRMDEEQNTFKLIKN
jgi:Secretion system C-terminal sorting domain/Glycine rich protein